MVSFTQYLFGHYQKERRHLRIISAVGVTCPSFMVTLTLMIRHERTDADYILKYENTGPSKTALIEVVNQTPAKTNDLREIVLKGKIVR